MQPWAEDVLNYGIVQNMRLGYIVDLLQDVAKLQLI